MRVDADSEAIMQVSPIGIRHLGQSAHTLFQPVQKPKRTLGSGCSARGKQDVCARHDAGNRGERAAPHAPGRSECGPRQPRFFAPHGDCSGRSSPAPFPAMASRRTHGRRC